MINDIAIKYNQRQAKLGLIFGIAFLALFLASFFFGGTHFYFPLGMSITYIVLFFYRKNRFYLRTENGFLIKDFGPKIPISHITETRRFAGDYIFKSGNKTITVDKNIIDKSSVNELEHFINQLRGVDKIAAPAMTSSD